MIHLDANFLVAMSKPTSPTSLKIMGWIAAREPLATSSVAWSEFLCGPFTHSGPASVRAVVDTPLPLFEAEAALAVDLFNLAGRRRGSLADCQIAATAIRAGAVLATTDRADFERFLSAGLRLAE